MKIALISSLIAAILVAAFIIALGGENQAHASAPSGFAATIATTTFYSIGAGSASTLFATSTLNNCVARSISTNNSPVELTFSDYAGQSPTGVNGVWQNASTTVVYDSGQYGCGLIKAYSYAAQTLTISEAR